MTGGLSWWHWMIILAVFILLFGAKKLPEAARGVGRSLRILKSEVSAMHEDEAKKAQPGETDVSAAVATPPAQIAGTPAATQYPAATGGTVVNGVPVANGVPVVGVPVVNAPANAVPVEDQRT